MHRSNRVIRLVLPVLTLAILACTCPFSLPDRGTVGTDAETETWQAAVDEIRLMTRGQTIPRHLLDPDLPVEEDVFDPNQLLVPLNHLSIRQGYTLDFIYRDDGIGAYPIVYARQEMDAPFESYEAYLSAADECDMENQPVGCDYLNFIEADGSEEAYFQWVLLRMMGDQFYLYWHAGYHDEEIIANPKGLGRVVGKMASTEFGEPLSIPQQKQALRIDPSPAVNIKEDSVTVRVVWFTKWGGFYETIYTLTTTAPYQVVNTETTQLVEYDCLVMF